MSTSQSLPAGLKVQLGPPQAEVLGRGSCSAVVRSSRRFSCYSQHLPATLAALLHCNSVCVGLECTPVCSGGQLHAIALWAGCPSFNAVVLCLGKWTQCSLGGAHQPWHLSSNVLPPAIHRPLSTACMMSKHPQLSNETMHAIGGLPSRLQVHFNRQLKMVGTAALSPAGSRAVCRQKRCLKTQFKA